MSVDSVELARDPVHETNQLYRAWLHRPVGGDALDRLLRHLRAVPFYRHTPAGALTDLPVVDRARYLADPSRFRSSASVAPYTLTSSGSTGEPLTVSLDEAAWYAVNYHFFTQVAALAGLPAGDFRPGRPAVLFVSNKPARHSFVRPLPGLNQGLYVRVQLSGAGRGLAELYQRLRAPILYGKPSYLLDLRSALLRQGLSRPPWSPRLLLVSGEPLYGDDRARLTGYFDAPVMDALASTEGGLIAATRPDADGYEVFADNVRLEVLDAGGAVRPTGAGELVVTNLVYRDTVVVRYRTGDHAELETSPSGVRQRLLRLWGREPRTVRFRTACLPTALVSERLGLLPGVADFQVVTGRDRGTLLRWMPDGAADADPQAARDRLGAALRGLLPEEDVEFERCERITPLGGKKRRFP